MDKITSDRIDKLHPRIRNEVRYLVQKANAALSGRAQVRIVQGLRTFAEQDALYAQGRTKPGDKVTKAKGGQSIHNYGLAIDFCLLIDGSHISWSLTEDWDGDKVSDWMEIVKIFTDQGYEWGGRWKFVDNPHLQKTFGYTWETLLQLHNSGKVDQEGYVLI